MRAKHRLSKYKGKEKMDKKTIIVIVLAIALIGSIGANIYQVLNAPQAGKPNVVDTTTLIAAMNDPQTLGLDPAVGYSGWGLSMSHECYETLLTFNGSDSVTPVGRIAQSWSVSADGKTWTFNLRHGVLFTSGRELKADDVVGSLRRVLNLSQAPVYLLTVLGITSDGIVKIDDYTISITIPQPVASSIVYCVFANEATGIIDMTTVLAHATSNATYYDYGQGWIRTEHSEGSGPYMVQSWEEGAKMVLVWNPTHWRWYGTTKVRDPPQIKTMIWLNTLEPATHLMEISKGDIDVSVGALTTDQLTGLRQSQSVALVPYPSIGYAMIRLMVLPTYKNLTNPLADNRVRQAIKFAINRDDLNNNYFKGLFFDLESMIPPTMKGYSDYHPYNYNITRAKELLTEAGYPNGFTMDMQQSPFEPFMTFAPKIKSDLALAGITVNIIQLDWNGWYAAYRPREFQSTFTGFGLDYNDPQAAVEPMAYSRTLDDTNPVHGSGWRCGWVNTHVADLIDQTRTLLSWDERIPLYNEIQRIWVDEGPIAMISWKYYETFAVRTWVQGLTANPMWYFESENINKLPVLLS